jgi:predicted nucleotidyltransferase
VDPEPTIYPELNEVLRALVTDAQAILRDDFVGVYLHGSFALGDADEYSDVDFVVVTNRVLDDRLFQRIQSMHGRLYELDIPWAKHLEGSYVSKESLRRVDPGSTYPFLDNGASELVWDDHCNNAVVRWTLREQGVVLAGPDPKSLIDPVSGEQLRSEASRRVVEYAVWARDPGEPGPMSRWKQSYLVLTFCRLLHTIGEGGVASKPAAGRWALRSLDPHWAGLIQDALDDRPDPWRRVHEPASPEAAKATLAFADYAVGKAAPRG